LGAKYTSQATSGYNSSPPPDDGSQGASNLITWAGIKTKLADVLKTFAEAINTQLVTALNLGPRAISSNDSVVAGDHWKSLQVSGGATITLGDASTLGAGFVVTVSNVGTTNSKITRTTVGDTINGVAQDLLLPPGCAVTLKVNAAANGYITDSARNVDLSIVEGRLTLTSGSPVTSGDVTSATTVYFTPYKGNRIALFDGTSQWNIMPFAEVSVAVPNTSSTVYDVFAYNNSGAVALEVAAWTSDTARVSALATQDGVYVRLGSTTRRYLGSFRTTAGINGQTEDSEANRLVWNYYNRVRRSLKKTDSTNSWSHDPASFRQANGSSANRVAVVIGVQEDAVRATVHHASLGPDATPRNTYTGVGIDSSTVNSAVSSIQAGNNGAQLSLTATYNGYPGLGYHELRWLEQGTGTSTTTFYGDAGATNFQTGITGETLA
jgi:hypothetical protein